MVHKCEPLRPRTPVQSTPFVKNQVTGLFLRAQGPGFCLSSGMALGVNFNEGPVGKVTRLSAPDMTNLLRVRENPFSTDRLLRVRYRFSTEDWKRLFAMLAHNRGRGTLVGQKGSGKTTLLEDLAIRLRHKGKDVTMIRLCADFPRLPGAFNPAFFASLSASDAVLLDGAEQLSFTHWLRFRWRTRRAGFVVITAYRAGRLRTLHRCATSPILLHELVASLGQELNPAEAEALHQRHDGDIRKALRELSDRYAKKTAGPLSFPALRT
jgi:energy-coupling factor transporter ATP-binding protein EcfA2